MKMMLAAGLSLLLFFSTAEAATANREVPSMQNLKVVLIKLKEATSYIGEISEMKSLGMPEKEVARLKEAPGMKIKQLTDDAIYAIHNL